jgi:2-polyprenyl-6-methoxyphenol hydroxylase-like FAD-dependent oxidoreductase
VTEPVDVLIVGAGPTGLALAAQLQAFGTGFRLVDRQLDRVHESRALAVQPRTLEVLAGLGLADTMVERGNPTVDLEVHGRRRTTCAPLFDIGLDDTRFPFLLFLSQAETEAILGEHLTAGGARIERGVELVGLDQHPEHVACTLDHRDGHREQIEARYVIGCDGAHSAVRRLAGIGFTGSAYPQTFVLADLDADGPRTGAAHGYLSAEGLLFLFPLVQPAAWRMLVMAPGSATEAVDEAPGLDELQALADVHTGGAARLHDPVWSTYFRIHHRHATHYRRGRAFLAGDAAHIHSPAGAQGMNTGIQEAWNLGWKLALVTAGDASDELLDTYEVERMPVGRHVLRFTDRAFRVATSTNPVIRLLRTRLGPDLVRLVLSSRRGRALAFRTLSQLAINYRHSPACQEGEPRLRRGARAGDRLPDAQVTPDGRPPTTLHQVLAPARFNLLLTGPPDAWPTGSAGLDQLGRSSIRVHQLAREPRPGALHDTSGKAHERFGVVGPEATAHHLVRPDGHIAYRAAGTDLAGLHRYLARWTLSPRQPPLDDGPSDGRLE